MRFYEYESKALVRARTGMPLGKSGLAQSAAEARAHRRARSAARS